MRYIILIVWFKMITISVNGQQNNIDLFEVYNLSLLNSNYDTISYLLTLDTAEITDYERMELYTIRGKLKLIFGEKELGKKEKLDRTILNDASDDFSYAITQTKDENDKLNYIYRRYFTLKDHDPYYKGYNSDYTSLKSNGFKKDKSGLGFTALTKYDGESWLGLEISLISNYGPRYTLKDGNSRIIHKKKYSHSSSAFVIGFAQNLETGITDYNLSIIRIESTLYVNITQIGVINAQNTNHWYLRPEIGFGYSIFQLSAGYTFFIPGGKSISLAKYIVSFRAKHTF